MNLTDVLAIFDQDQRINIEYPDMRKDILPQVIRFVAPRPRMSFVLHSHLDEQTADTVIAEQIAYFQQLNQSFEWKVYDYDTPADLRDRLVAHELQLLGEAARVRRVHLAADGPDVIGARHGVIRGRKVAAGARAGKWETGCLTHAPQGGSGW